MLLIPLLLVLLMAIVIGCEFYLALRRAVIVVERRESHYGSESNCVGFPFRAVGISGSVSIDNLDNECSSIRGAREGDDVRVGSPGLMR